MTNFNNAKPQLLWHQPNSKTGMMLDFHASMSEAEWTLFSQNKCSLMEPPYRRISKESPFGEKRKLAQESSQHQLFYVYYQTMETNEK